jgi:hypothetical protein
MNRVSQPTVSIVDTVGERPVTDGLPRELAVDAEGLVIVLHGRVLLSLDFPCGILLESIWAP